ncbi:MAG: hypothetical protein RIC56_07985 [Pseudomonadales bacterium]
MKAFVWIVGLVLLVIVGVGVYVVMNSGSLLEQAIESYGSEYLGAPVSVGGVNVALAEGSAAIDALEIGNPRGFSGPAAFKLGNLSATLDPQRTTSELVVLKSVSIDGAEINALAQGKETNLQRLMDNLNAQIGANQRAEETGVESEVKLIIDRFSFTNARASVTSDLLGNASVTLPDIQLSDIGRASNGATVGQVLKQVLDPIVRSVSRQLLQQQGLDLDGAREKIEENVRERAGEKISEGLKSLTDKLRGDR